MTGQTIEHLVANRWAEALDADDAEVLGFWRRAIESLRGLHGAAREPDRAVEAPVRRRQGVVAFNAAHGYRAKGTSDHHQHTFAVGVALAPEPLKRAIGGMQVQRGIRHDREYGAHRMVTEEEIGAVRDSVCTLLNGLADEIRQVRPAIKQAVKKLRCPT